MATLKRDRRGSFILRFRTGGRGSKLEYHNLGPVTRDEAKTRAAELQAEAKRRRGLADPGVTFASLAKTPRGGPGFKRESVAEASRIGQMIDLRWGTVDFERGSVAIEQTKTGRTKAFTLKSEMRAVLSTVPRGIGNAHVFTYQGVPWAFWPLSEFFEKTVAAAGLVGP